MRYIANGHLLVMNADPSLATFARDDNRPVWYWQSTWVAFSASC